jgi:hypothetical protein
LCIQHGGGKGAGLLGNKFVGLLGAFAVYDRALSPAELASVCDARMHLEPE